MANTSATGGALLPSTSPTPLEGEALVDFFQEWVVALTGIEAALVRPRWQREPGNIPDENQTWVAIGITKRVKDTFAAEVHHKADPGYNEVQRHEVLHFLTSFYGPDADEMADRFAHGMQLAQNREVLFQNSMGLVESGDALSVPELVKDRWLYRIDLTFSIKRQLVRQYAVYHIGSADVEVDNEHYVTPITV